MAKTLNPADGGFRMGRRVKGTDPVVTDQGTILRESQGQGLTLTGIASVTRTLPNGETVTRVSKTGRIVLRDADLAALFAATEASDGIRDLFAGEADAVDPAESRDFADAIGALDGLTVGDDAEADPVTLLTL